jgi:serine/threonine protein kinase
LGTGAYGVVYSAIDHHTNTWYAVKALSKTNSHGEPLDRRQREFQQREIQLHYAASLHPNVVSMLKIVDDPECTYVVLEYCPEGDLFSNITEKGRYVNNDYLVRKAFLQILDAVEHCHQMGIYHRDLKPENILVSNLGSKVLLADFGLATTDLESDDHGCGSTFYMSPECLDQSSRSASYQCAPNDVWSLGVILVNLTCGRNPWKQASTEDSTYRAFTRDPEFLKSILPLSDELNDILCRIFERNPENRITVRDLRLEIERCSSFSAQPLPAQLFTPPTSPQILPEERSDSAMSVSSSTGGSLTSSGSSDSDSDSDSGSEITEPESEPFEIITPTIDTKPQRVAAPAPFTPQAYVLPSQEFSPNPWGTPAPAKPASWFHSWGHNSYEHQYEQRHATSPVHYVSPIQPALYYPATSPHYYYSW